MTKIAIFASGSGSNAENIIQTLKAPFEVVAIYCNNPSAGVITRAKKLNTECVIFNRDDLYTNPTILDNLQEKEVEYIILAGFLWLIPQNLVNQYSNKILNIHPALLPNYGGKGMYGDRIHKAVIENKEKESGITIHLVNENYDEGEYLFQTKCAIEEGDTHSELAQKIHALEYEHFPKVIADYIKRDQQ